MLFEDGNVDANARAHLNTMAIYLLKMPNILRKGIILEGKYYCISRASNYVSAAGGNPHLFFLTPRSFYTKIIDCCG